MKKTKRSKWHKEMYQHYKELHEVALGELQFERLQKQYYNNLIDEVEVLVNKGVKKELISKVIELGRLRGCLDISIHYDLINK